MLKLFSCASSGLMFPHTALCLAQGGNHNNPQRDPFPSTTLPSSDARIGDVSLQPSVLLNTHTRLRADAHAVKWTGKDLQQSRGHASTSVRYEEEDSVLAAVAASPAAAERFVHTRQERYLYSPYNEEILSDIEADCNAGDLRVVRAHMSCVGHKRPRAQSQAKRAP